jgi:quercetin dioxygenase-like cupin family protein
MLKRHATVEIKEGVFRSLIHTDHLMVAVLDFTNGPWKEPEPFHSHPHEQVSYVAEGEIIFYCEGAPDQALKAGDVFAVESGRKHTIRVLTPKVRLVDSFSPIREEFLPNQQDR